MKITKRRAGLLLGVAAVIAALFSPSAYWRIVGWSRGELFFDGRPVSYWRAEFESYRVQSSVGGFSFNGVFSNLPLRQPSVFEQVLYRVNGVIGRTTYRGDELVPPMSECPESLPVLLVLLNDPSAKVRWSAAMLIGTLRGNGTPALTALRERLTDAEPVGAGETPGHAAASAIRTITEAQPSQ